MSRTEPAGRVWRSAAALGSVAVLGTTLLASVDHFTRDRIASQQQRVVLEQLNQVLSATSHDNELHRDLIQLRSEVHFPGQQEVSVYRARLAGEPVAAVFRVIAPDGYSGDIELLVGVGYDGKLTGVRVTQHKETPGLGDGIEVERSNWIEKFRGRSLQDPPPERWTVRKHGGEFDQMTGATITPRAVVHAVRRTLQYFAENRQYVFEQPAAGPSETVTESP